MATCELIARWPLAGNANDEVGNNHGEEHGISYGEGPGGLLCRAAFFDGIQSHIRVQDNKSLRLGGRDFSISAWVRCTMPMRGVLGDLLCKFDPQQRCGFNLNVAGSAPAYNGMSDSRHVHFGIDDGYLSGWEDCGHPETTNSGVLALVVYQGDLYCGTADGYPPERAGRVFRWKGGQDWEDCGRLGHDPGHLSAMSMVVHDGKLYAGTGVFDWVRAAGRDFQPALSRVFEYQGGMEWRDLGPVGKSVRVLCMASFDGELYAGLDRAGGGHCFKYDGSRWIDCGAPNGDNVQNLIAYRDDLFAATHGIVWKYEGGQQWTCRSHKPHGITQTHCLQVARGKLLAGTWPQGYVLRDDGGEEWTDIGRLGLPEGLKECNEINDLNVYNGKLYAGVLPKAQVYRYESDKHWTLLGSLATRPDYEDEAVDSWRRVTSLVPHRGRLFASTCACKGRAVDVDPEKTLGRVYSVQAGAVASHERDIGGNWTHLCAVREGRAIRLYINGELSSSAEAPAGQHFDLSNTQDLLIGFGPQNTFAGAIADIRIHSGALTQPEIVQNISFR